MDGDLERLRAQRLAELKGQQPQQQQRNPEDEKAREDMRRSVLAQILDNSARERLNTLSIVKPEKSKAVEDLIIRMAQSGRIQKRLVEQDVIDLLSQLQEDQPKKQVTIQRRRYSDSEDEYTF